MTKIATFILYTQLHSICHTAVHVNWRMPSFVTMEAVRRSCPSGVTQPGQTGRDYCCTEPERWREVLNHALWQCHVHFHTCQAATVLRSRFRFPVSFLSWFSRIHDVDECAVLKQVPFLSHTGGYLAIGTFTRPDGIARNLTPWPASDPLKGQTLGETLQATLEDMVEEQRITRVCNTLYNYGKSRAMSRLNPLMSTIWLQYY